MKKTHVFAANDLACAEHCVAAARKPGLDDEDISLIAKSGLQLEGIPEDLRHLARSRQAAQRNCPCVYLASEDARFVTGQVLHINGGSYSSA